MLSNPTNILDQLLGCSCPTQAGSSGEPDVDQPGERAFADVISLLAGNESPTSLTSAQLFSAIPKELSLPVLDQSADNETEAQTQSGSRPWQAPAWSDEPLITSPNIRELVNRRPTERTVELEPAVYRVLDSRVTGDKLELTVAAGEKNAEPVRLIVPVELLLRSSTVLSGEPVAKLQPGMGQQSFPARVPLVDTPRQCPAGFERLLSGLNLKALEVGFEPPGKVTEAGAPDLELRLIAGDTASQVVIRSRLSRREVKVSAVPEKNVPSKPAEAPRLSHQPAVVATKRPKSQQLVDLVEKIEVKLHQPSAQQTASLDGVFKSKSAPFARLLNVSPEAPAVKLSLPKIMEAPLGSTGQSIMIRIEPDHLGPARLYLSMRNDQLTARVTVETPIAKAAVEQSLDQLTDQLSRAGIQVDRIEVGLNGGDTRNQFFNRQSGWMRRRGFANTRHNNKFDMEQVTPPPVLPPPTREFVGADGVNLLA